MGIGSSKEIEALKESTELAYSGKGLKEFPKELWGLTHFIKMELKDNELVELPSFLGTISFSFLQKE